MAKCGLFAFQMLEYADILGRKSEKRNIFEPHWRRGADLFLTENSMKTVTGAVPSSSWLKPVKEVFEISYALFLNAYMLSFKINAIGKIDQCIKVEDHNCLRLVSYRPGGGKKF